MAKTWRTPFYKLETPLGKPVVINVTRSVSAGLPPTKVLTEKIIPLFQARNVRRIVDFGSGALRHAIPLLEEGFTVCAVDFEAGYQRPATADALKKARSYGNFCELVWPQDFIKDRSRWDAALLCYVLQTMPVPQERELLLKILKTKLVNDAYVFYTSRYNQVAGTITNAQRVSDGYFMYPKHTEHSFYREFRTDETHAMMKRFGFEHIRSLSERGTDQMFLYAKGNAFWI
jgi:hypothetical protein